MCEGQGGARGEGKAGKQKHTKLNCLKYSLNPIRHMYLPDKNERSVCLFRYCLGFIGLASLDSPRWGRHGGDCEE